MTGKKDKTQSATFEESMAELEQLVETMEKGELTLEQSLETFERGVKLTRICQKALEEAEQKVRILSENQIDAELEPFDSEH